MFNEMGFSLILIAFTPMKYSAAGLPWKIGPAELSGFLISGVKVRDLETSIPESR